MLDINLIEKENGDLDCPQCGVTCGFSWHDDYQEGDKILCSTCGEYCTVPEFKLKVNSSNKTTIKESAYDAFDRGFTAGYNAGVKMELTADKHSS